MQIHPKTSWEIYNSLWAQVGGRWTNSLSKDCIASLFSQMDPWNTAIQWLYYWKIIDQRESFPRPSNQTAWMKPSLRNGPSASSNVWDSVHSKYLQRVVWQVAMEHSSLQKCWSFDDITLKLILLEIIAFFSTYYHQQPKFVRWTHYKIRPCQQKQSRHCYRL